LVLYAYPSLCGNGPISQRVGDVQFDQRDHWHQQPPA
jgi:hypothetical protein